MKKTTMQRRDEIRDRLRDWTGEPLTKWTIVFILYRVGLLARRAKRVDPPWAVELKQDIADVLWNRHLEPLHGRTCTAVMWRVEALRRLAVKAGKVVQFRKVG